MQLFCFQESYLTISESSALEGGGIHAISSSIKAMVTGQTYVNQNGEKAEQYKGAQLNILRNTAQRGGGIYLEANSKITLLKDYIFDSNIEEKALNLTGNQAKINMEEQFLSMTNRILIPVTVIHLKQMLQSLNALLVLYRLKPL